jgi:hypothetical protein
LFIDMESSGKVVRGGKRRLKAEGLKWKQRGMLRLGGQAQSDSFRLAGVGRICREKAHPPSLKLRRDTRRLESCCGCAGFANLGRHSSFVANNEGVSR